MDTGCTYEIRLAGNMIEQGQLLGIAFLGYETARLIDAASAELLRVWHTADPVLGGVDRYDYETGGWVHVGPPRRRDPETCEYRRTPEITLRPANALNIEIGAPADRCVMKPPIWPEGHGNLSWLLSGGSLIDYGYCDGCCPTEAL